jgi:hypothetical protein
LWPPINVNDVFRCSYRRPSSCRCTKRYSCSFSSAPSGDCPSSADRAISSSGNFLPEPIAPPLTPLLAKRTTKSGVSAPYRWICAISAYSDVARALRSSPNDRSDAPSPDLKRSLPSKLPRAPRRICPFANALHALPHASVVIHTLPRARRSSHAPALSGSSSHALWNLLAREIHAPYQSLANETHAPTRLLARELHALLAATGFARAPHPPGVLSRPRAYWRVRCACPCSQHTLARALHTPGAPHHYPAATCLSESCHVSPSSATCQASKKKKKTDPDPIFSARSNGLEPDLLKWVRPSIGPRVSVF